MKDKVNVRVLLTGLSLLGVFIAAAVVVVLMLAPRDDSPSFPETSSIDRPAGGNDEESSRSETDPITNTPGAGGGESAITLLDQLRRSRRPDEPVCLVTFDYDRMIERALGSVGVTIKTISLYTPVLSKCSHSGY